MNDVRKWTDQADYLASGEQLLYFSLGGGIAIQIIKYVPEGRSPEWRQFAVTAGNLFGSETRLFTKLEDLLVWLDGRIRARKD